MARREALQIGSWRIGKECGGRWFPHAGRGYWDGFKMFLRKPMNLKFHKWNHTQVWKSGGSKGFSIGPLMVWKNGAN
ncbi:hypothetical protein SEA_TRIBBY_89 [Arthrobacter phage Tribby]|uniref:Uncharacterized protein n=1 Tax=Arthrobacter phage Tribby TaxID=2024279 RepID=A0A222Z903_9CAUD|nr:hypothetical protein PQB75_gp089 [Arthrobacter phage Tribby]ASR80540.1 hypothetical protein SEA_TRIBBY_89 [Arthrobacter phage Tribby]